MRNAIDAIKTHLLEILNVNDTKFIVFYDGENNGYHDSDFYHVALDLENVTIAKKYIGSTRHAGYTPFDNFVHIDSIKCKEIKKLIIDTVNEVASDMTNVLLKSPDYEINPNVGDHVEITKPRAKNRGTKGTIVKFYDKYYQRMFVATMAVLNDGTETNITNLTVTEPCEDTIENIRLDILYGRLKK